MQQYFSYCGRMRLDPELLILQLKLSWISVVVENDLIET